MERIDLSKKPKIGQFDRIVSNVNNGELFLNKEMINSRVKPYVSEAQRIGGVSGKRLLEELPEKTIVFNSIFLDWLLRNPGYIPESWKSKFTFFAGTIFMKDGVEVVRFLYFGLNGWASSYRWLNRGFHLNSPVAILEAA